jgi:hypothetical protein
VDRDNIGYCRKCGETKDFREGIAQALKNLYRTEWNYWELSASDAGRH